MHWRLLIGLIVPNSFSCMRSKFISIYVFFFFGNVFVSDRLYLFDNEHYNKEKPLHWIFRHCIMFQTVRWLITSSSFELVVTGTISDVVVYIIYCRFRLMHYSKTFDACTRFIPPFSESNFSLYIFNAYRILWKVTSYS